MLCGGRVEGSSNSSSSAQSGRLPHGMILVPGAHQVEALGRISPLGLLGNFGHGESGAAMILLVNSLSRRFASKAWMREFFVRAVPRGDRPLISALAWPLRETPLSSVRCESRTQLTRYGTRFLCAGFCIIIVQLLIYKDSYTKSRCPNTPSSPQSVHGE